MCSDMARFSLAITAAALASLARPVSASLARRNLVLRNQSRFHLEAQHHASAFQWSKAGLTGLRSAPAAVHPPNSSHAAVLTALSGQELHPIDDVSSRRGYGRLAFLQEWGKRQIQSIRTKSTGTSIVIVVMVVIGVVMGVLLWQNNWNVKETTSNTGRQMQSAVQASPASLERRSHNDQFGARSWDTSSSYQVMPQQSLLPASLDNSPRFSRNQLGRKGGCC